MMPRDVAILRRRRGWLPTDVSSLLGHWRADYGCEQDGVPCANGDPVSLWRPVYGTVDLVEPLSSQRPIWRTAVFDALPGVDFDGSNDYLTANALATHFTGQDKPMTVVAVTYPDASALQAVLGLGSSSSATPYRMCYQTGAGNNYISAYNRDDASVGKTVTTTIGAAPSAPHIVAWRWNGQTVDQWVDGAASLGGDVDVGTLTLTDLYVGVGRVYGSLVYPFNGKIGVLMLFAAALSDDDIQNAMYYASQVYCRAVPISPPAGA